MGHNPNTKLTEEATILGAVEVKQDNSKRKVLVKSGQQTSVRTEVHQTKLVAMPITEQLKQQIRITSAIAKADTEFTQPEAVKILGSPGRGP